MKKITTTTLLLLMLLLTACSGADDTATGQLHLGSSFNSEGVGYLTLSIHRPVTDDTRAGGANGQFEKGSAEEMKVNSMMLVLLNGAAGKTEDDLTVASFYYIEPNFSDATLDQISNEESRIVQLSKDHLNENDELYMLVLLNATTSDLIPGTTTFSALKKLKLKTVGNTTDGLVMTNAPLANEPGGSHTVTEEATVTTLAKLDPASIKPTKAQAEASDTPKSHIFVERAAAKITAGIDPAITKIRHTDISILSAEVALDRYNTQCFITRHYDGNWSTLHRDNQYRFIEASPVLTGEAKYRTYWAEDDNYDTATGLATYDKDTYIQEGGFRTLGTLASPTVYYCAENTINYDQQTLDKTTSLIVRLKLYEGTFYTASLQDDVIYTEEPEDPDREEGTSGDSSFKPRRAAGDNKIDDYLRTWLYSQPAIKTWVDTWALGDPSYLHFSYSTDPLPASADNVKVTITVDDVISAAGKAAFDALAPSPEALIAKRMVIKKYTDGWCYYRIPIKHFGDELTPWIQGDYGSAAEFLGRYGVVRNNWYNVEVTAVNRIGSTSVPQATDTDRDDRDDDALSLKVSIAPWLNHAQDLAF